MESGYVKSNGARLYYEVAGAGTPVALIHAGVADSRQWDAEFADLAKDHRVLRYDLRGYGQSKPVEGAFSNLADLVAVLAHVGMDESLVLIGNSMGGTLAMNFTLSHPDRVRALVMVGSGPAGLSLDVPEHPAMEKARQAWAERDLAMVKEYEAQVWFDGMGRDASEVDQTMRQRMLDMNGLALEHDLLELGERVQDLETQAADRLAEISTPVLLIVGEHDVPYMHAAAEIMLDQLPNAKYVGIPGAAHLPNMEQPDSFISAVRVFLAELNR